MRLFSVTLLAFRKFRDDWMNLDAPLVAIIGPNEAGKTSLLRAIEQMNDDADVPGTDVMRGKPEADLRIEMRLRLDDDEISRLGPMDPESAPVWLIVRKGIGGIRKASLSPRPSRDLRPRIVARRVLANVSAKLWFREWATQGEGSAARETIDGLASDEENMDETQLDGLHTLAEQLRGIGVSNPTGLRLGKGGASRAIEAADVLDRLVDHESLPQPSERASELLSAMPPFLGFSEALKSIRSTYNLEDESDFNAPALRLLCGLGDIDLIAVREAMRQGNDGRVKTLLEAGSERLSARLTERWGQSTLQVSLDPQGNTVRLFVRSPGAEYFYLHERSDGMRAFLALLAFVAGQPPEPRPILLVDEAETHLHYDAQAELISMLEEQTAVASVIYTTHSVGCLPQDLGRGVRVVEPSADSDYSDLKNGWWQSGKGLSPLSIAMGAVAMSLVPARRAVFGEGPTDSMLLPTMLREVSGRNHLPFQILPGVSEASDDELRAINRQAPEVAYVVDGDSAASRLAQRLRRIGVPENRILSLGVSEAGDGFVVEDLLDPVVYSEAVNEELRSWPPGTGAVELAKLPGSRRPTYVEATCARIPRNPPSKVQIAAEVLNGVMKPRDLTAAPISAMEHQDRLRGLLDSILEAVGLPVLE